MDLKISLIIFSMVVCLTAARTVTGGPFTNLVGRKATRPSAYTKRSSVWARSVPDGYNGGGSAVRGGYNAEEEPGMPFSFQYDVNESDNFHGHSQSSDGKAVIGRYYVQLPDGRLQRVDFRADASGYNADVQYEVNPGFQSQPTNKFSPSGYSSGSPATSSLVSNSLGSIGTGIGGVSIGQLPLAPYAGPEPAALSGQLQNGSNHIQGAHSIVPY